MPYGDKNDPVLEEVAVFPSQRVMDMNGEQQLVVTAKYSDGSLKDATRSSIFEVNDEEVGEVDLNVCQGFRTTGRSRRHDPFSEQGDRFPGNRALGAPVDDLPPLPNYVDKHIFTSLKRWACLLPRSARTPLSFAVSLDITGRLPSVKATKAFLADQDPEKRDKLIDQLLDSPEYADFFANKWSALLRNKRTKTSYQRGNFAFHGWIRDSLDQNKPYDQFVREVVAASGEVEQHPPVAWYREVKTVQNQLEDVSQLFLGTRIQCAQCHHHPFEKWSQEDYYKLSAFFSQVGREKTRFPDEEIIFHKRGVAKATNKKNNQQVEPAGLGADSPELRWMTTRGTLVDWMSKDGNRSFPHLGQSLLEAFFGRGLVDPEDDMRETNPSVNPELLEELASTFVANKFDMKQLIRDICRLNLPVQLHPQRLQRQGQA